MVNQEIQLRTQPDPVFALVFNSKPCRKVHGWGIETSRKGRVWEKRRRKRRKKGGGRERKKGKKLIDNAKR